eukprot:3771359-Prymnesium_polylepis.1
MRADPAGAMSRRKEQRRVRRRKTRLKTERLGERGEERVLLPRERSPVHSVMHLYRETSGKSGRLVVNVACWTEDDMILRAI